MNVKVRHEGDVQWLEELIRGERHALRRDRFRAVLLALQGEQATQIVERLGRARRSVQACWVYAYRDGGIEALPATTLRDAVDAPNPEDQRFEDERHCIGLLRDLAIKRQARDHSGGRRSETPRETHAPKPQREVPPEIGRKRSRTAERLGFALTNGLRLSATV